jgi:internalin A
MNANEQKAYDEALSRIKKCLEEKKVVLDISDLGINKIPLEISQLTQLQLLDLSGNRITEIPESISNLTSLRTIYLFNNQITEIPESISNLTSLQSLHLSGNEITEIPESISNLTSLQNLQLSFNEITEIPISIDKLASLRILNLSYNHITGIPESILSQYDKPKVILDYYFRLRRGARPLNEAKLILVGRGGVGKSTLIERLVHNRFETGKKMTEGIEITHWDFKLRNEKVRLNIWDFGGQEINHATHQFFLTERSLYLLVLNGRGNLEDADAEYWLKLINSWGKDSPVIVVLNKIKEFPFDINRTGLQRDYPAIKAIIKTDCEDPAPGIDDLRQTIERETDRLENLRDKFPAAWFSIKEKLAKPDKDFLSFDEYKKICEELGEKDEEAQERLAWYLHRLGIALNYKDDPRLQDTHVLNPHWVTNGIYKILNSQKLKEQKGVIHLRDLNGIFKNGAYPPYMRRFLLDLMKKFELCFSFTDDECRYLIPELLDKNEPDETAEFVREECLNFEYHYPVLTEGLLPRFIVRTHNLSEGLPRWRTGVVLQFEGCLALVKADVQDKKVFISIKGKARDARRRLLAVIRYEFEAIHRHLEPKEMVPLPRYPSVVVPYSKLLVLEKNNVRPLVEVIGEEVKEFDVQELLNGIDLEGERRKDRLKDERMGKKIQLFYSYSHKDEKLRDELENQLKILQRADYIDSWHDRKILAGEEWKEQIDVNLERADIILLLISADFIASDYCYDIEMKRALERHENGEARVIPVIVRDANWRIAPFAKLQSLPKDVRAVTLWEDKDSAWRNVSEGIERVVKQMRKR